MYNNDIRRQAALRVLINRIVTETSRFDCLTKHMDEDRTMLEVKIHAAWLDIEKNKNAGQILEGALTALLDTQPAQVPPKTQAPQPAQASPKTLPVINVEFKPGARASQGPLPSKDEVYAALVKAAEKGPVASLSVAKVLGADMNKTAIQLEFLSRDGCVSKIKQTKHGLVSWTPLKAPQEKADPAEALLAVIRSYPGEEFTSTDLARATTLSGRNVAAMLGSLARRNWVIPTEIVTDAHGNPKQRYRKSSRLA
jgi:hypothetical protein